MSLLLNPYRFSSAVQAITLLHKATGEVTSYTEVGVNLGAESATRQFWLAVSQTDQQDSVATATLGGSAMTLRMSLDADRASGDIDLHIFSLDTLTTGATGDLVVDMGGVSTQYSLFLLRVAIAVNTTASSTGTTNTLSLGTYDHPLNVTPGGLIIFTGGMAGSGTTSNATMSGLDNIEYNNQGSSGGNRRCLAWEATTLTETVTPSMTTTSNGSSVMGIITAFYPPI